MGVYNQWNTEALERAVRSVLCQSLGDFEFIIWDDGSEGEAALALKKLPEKDARIILAGRDENRGLAFSLNECIKLAKGKYIARMDADDECLPERFARQVEFLESNPEYAWCGTGAELFDENGAWGYRRMPEIPQKKDYYKYSPYIHPSVMFRRSVFDSFAGYLEEDETYRCEDYEIFMRLMQKGLKGYNLPEPLFRYFECSDSYRSRNVKNRINEARVRANGYKKMGTLFPFGWIYVLRPIVACIVPSGIIASVKRCEGKKAKAERESVNAESCAGEQIIEVSEYSTQDTCILGSYRRVSS
ncbi:MAG: glycosyltransferase [Lachnospiraceae bacterium]|nr:glycosyltransferase [Lachnospiraceae bacterium]